MTDRDITGQIKRSSLNRLPALLGIDTQSLTELADRVRQFDRAQSDETRQRKALEKVAQLFGQSILIETPSEKHAKDNLRRREVEALELMAVAQAHEHEELRATGRYQALLRNMDTAAIPSVISPKNVVPTREQGE